MSAHYVGQIAPNYIHSTMQSNSSDDSFTFTVGKLDAGMAILIGDKASLIEFPSLLLPPGVSSGSVVNIRVMRNDEQERRQKDEFDQLQEDILHTFGQQSPKAPALRLRNVTQTSVTLEWDRLSLATATLLSLDIYRNGQRLAPIPNPLHNTSTKLSGLDVNAEYTFHLVLKTTAGTFSSPVIKTRTHTINDTSGISVCFGHVHDAEMLEATKQALTNMKAKWSDRIQIDTTHYVCTDPRNPGDANAERGAQGHGYSKAMQLSIPAVLPHWVFACYEQKKMVGISAFYLDQDPPNASTIRASIGRVLGKQETAPASASTGGSSASSAPPPPLEKDAGAALPPAAVPAGETAEQQAAEKPIPFAADDVSPLSDASAASAALTNHAEAEASGSALGLNLASSAADSPQETSTITQPPPPIITTSGPSEDCDLQHPQAEAEAETTPTQPAPPQLVITSDSQEQISQPGALSEPPSARAEVPASGITTDNLEPDEDADGEMDDVSLGGGTNADEDDIDKFAEHDKY